MELLAEAEEVVKDAPPEVIGNKNDIDAPKGPDAGRVDHGIFRHWNRKLVSLTIEKNFRKILWTTLDAGTWWDVLLSGGTTHKNIIPFGPYLEDDADLTKRKYINGFMGRDRLGTIIILIRVSIVFLILLLLPFFVAKYLVRSILWSIRFILGKFWCMVIGYVACMLCTPSWINNWIPISYIIYFIL